MLRREVRSFIACCETIHSVLAQGEKLTPDESEVIEMSAIELLSKLRQPNPKLPATDWGHAFRQP